MKTLSIDIESFSSTNLQKSGAYRYAESDDFEILLFAYAVDGGEVKVVDLANGEALPLDIKSALMDDTVQKWAFNAAFERVCLSKYLGLDGYLKPDSWYCTMVWSATLGLPLSLEGVGAVLGLDKQKLSEGKNLVRYFCVPCLPTQTNGGRARNHAHHDLDKWEAFKTYNIRDVEAELSIQQKLAKFPVSEELWQEYHLDQEINDRGIGLDMTFVNSAIKMDAISRKATTRQLEKLTGLENPNSVLQLREWLDAKGLEINALDKSTVNEALQTTTGVVNKALLLRQQLAKSSVKKYHAMKNAVCHDGRARGMFQFYGANRTGRFSGKLIQLQNLPQNHLPDLAEARALVRAGDYESLELLYDSMPHVLSELIRTTFVPQKGQKFIVADFSAIEARVIAWLAGEQWRLDVFKNGGDIYCASASQMFHVPVVKGGENGHLRQKGKVSELGLGYSGSVGALKAMGALNMGLTEDELQPLVTTWREANPNIVALWWAVDEAATEAVKYRTTTETHGIKFTYQSGMLFITLLSARRLAYVKPRIELNRFGRESVTYEGVGATKKWERLESYGGKFVENIVQAMSRDILCFAMQNLRNYRIVAHVHDEVIIEAPKDVTVDDICRQMSRTPSWAAGLLLTADGYECEFYKKD